MIKSVDYKGIKVVYNINRKNNHRNIVLLHGFLENQTIWETYRKELAKSNTVITIDLLGHGKTDCSGYIHSMEEMAEAVKKVLHTEKIRKSILVGHSMGGYVALAYSEMFPDNVSGLCLFNSTASADSEIKKSERDRAIKVIKKNHERFIKEAIPNLFHEKDTRKSKNNIKKMVKEALTTPVQGIIAALEGMKIRDNREIVVKFAPYPIFYIIGKNDPLIPFENLIEQAKLNEQSNYFLSEGGHVCFYEDSYPCLTALKNFIISCKK